MPTSPSDKARLVVTLGDAAGIGPEIILKALSHHGPKNSARFLVTGPASFLNKLSRKLKIPLHFEAVTDLKKAWSLSGSSIACFFPEDDLPKFEYGKSNKALSKIAMSSIKIAATLALEGVADGIVTAPINKAGVQEAGFDIPGHTEYLAEFSNTKRYEMMLVGGGLRVVPVTRHVRLSSVAKLLTKDRITDAILLVYRELRLSFGITKPRIYVCGLNPHAGDNGHFGDEEIEVIGPAVEAARKKAPDAILGGPFSPDALFFRAYREGSDAVICMYHDQGLIPLKMIAMDSGVNVTLGLPFVRTSPDHGTGYDIAGKFRANPLSMIESLRLAASLGRNRKTR